MTLFVPRVERHVDFVRVGQLSRRIRLALHGSDAGRAPEPQSRAARRPAL